MIEADMRRTIVKALGGLDAMSVENLVRPGTPDVNYIEGWIELKLLKAWPVREDTPVRVPCFTTQQRAWLRKRWKFGGKAFFLIRIEKDWLLFNGEEAGKYVGQMTKREMIAHAMLYMQGRLDKRALIEALR